MIAEHKEDVFEAIKLSLLESTSLNYSKLYEKVNEKLKLSRNKPNVKYALSTRDFGSEINLLSDEGLLTRRQDDQSKNKIKPVYFSLTEKAIKQHRFEILGISREKQYRLQLYRLLFFHQTFSVMRRISKEQFDKILCLISVTEKDLVIHTHSHSSGTNVTHTTYKPIKHIQFQKIELSDVGPKGETAILYSYRFLAFSAEEIMEYLEGFNNNERLVPFVNSINFEKEEGKEEFRKAFNNLKDGHLIEPIVDIFGKIRYIISDGSIRDLIDKIWAIHVNQLNTLYRKMLNLEPPNDKEKQWLQQIFGKEETDRMIRDFNKKRFSVHRENKKFKEIQDSIEYDNHLAEAFKKHVSEKYEKVIEEYGFPIDLIEDVCLGRIFYSS
jgi:hypothetical protein